MSLDTALSILFDLNAGLRTVIPGLRGEICINAHYPLRLLEEAIELISKEVNRPEAPLPEWMGAGPHYVVATECDNVDQEIYTCNMYGQPVLKYPWLKPCTAIVHEINIHDATMEECRKRAGLAKNKYGGAAIFRLQLVEVLP